MALYTLTEIETEISDWKAALSAVRLGKEYSIGTRKLVRQDLQFIREHLEWLDTQRTQLKRGGKGSIAIAQGRVAR